MLRFISTKLYFLPLWAWQVMPVVIILLLNTTVTYGAELQQRSIAISQDYPGTIAAYQVGFTLPAGETLGSVEILFCSNSPEVEASCIPPDGMDALGVHLVSQSGVSGFSLSNITNPNTIVITRTPSVANAGPISFDFNNIVNPDTFGTFYARIMTYPTPGASGQFTDSGGIALSTANLINVSATVPPYLLFCVGVVISDENCANASGDLINFGDLSPQATAAAESQMLVATNGAGYSIQVAGSTLTSGNNIVPPLVNDNNSVPGQDQFGLNLVANSQPNVGSNAQGPGSGTPASGYAQPNLFKFSNGDVIAYSTQPSDLKEYTVSYIINIASNQPPGYYATTLTYVGVGNF